jgi:hypothetical protein
MSRGGNSASDAMSYFQLCLQLASLQEEGIRKADELFSERIHVVSSPHDAIGPSAR